MNKIFTGILLVLVVTVSAQGWRADEQQLRVAINSQAAFDAFIGLKLSFDDLHNGEVRAYVTPKEKQLLEGLGLAYEVEIADLNAYSKTVLQGKDAWHSYQEIIDLADSLVSEFPDICQKIVYGESLGGRELSALKISDNVSVDEPEAEVMFDGGIHGDEYPCAENVIRFARDLCIAYDEDPDITYLINNREIWLYLMVNPDGRVAVSRYNNNGVDLNRDWAYMWDAWGGSTGPCSQVESKALRECMYNNQFVVHTTYHAGTEYISLPWSYRSQQPADWNHIYQLGGLYSSSSTYSNLTYGQGNTGMYAINGSTKDSNYGLMGSISWSMEISYDKMPPTSQISPYYNRNYPAMLTMIEYSGYGLEGVVTDATSGEPVTAVVFVNDYMPTYSDPTAGDYHKYVLPGTYSITIVANGYESQTIDNVVVSANSATATDFQLQPADGQYVYKFAASRIPDNNEADEGNTKAVIGEPDDINYSIGKNGWVVLDMQTPVIDGPGMDLIVYEGDSSPEGYTCSVGETIDGPWISLGSGTGTSEFDIANSGLVEAQYVRIVDDGDGSANISDAGFDLDAIEALAPVSGIYLAMYDYEIDDSQGNNNGRIDPGETVDIIVELKNNGDITAENISGDISTASPYVTLDINSASFGTLSQGQSALATYTITANAATPQGEPLMIILDVDANSGGYTISFDMSFSIGLIVEDWESGNLEQFEWVTNGDNIWDISTENPYEGTYCIKSGSINDQQSTYLELTIDVLADGEIGFFKKVSSESSYDFLVFYIDGSVVDQWSGDVSWAESVYPVTTGTHTFKWAYEKDYSVSSGSDCAWVDFITLPSGALTALYAGFIADETDICQETIVNFTDMSSGDVVTWEWEFEGGSPASSNAQNPSVAYFDEGSYDVSLTVSDGSNTHSVIFEDYISVSAIPVVPEMPTGEDAIISYPGVTADYTISEVAGAESYIWEIDPPAAGTLIQNGTTCTYDPEDYWEGDLSIKVKAINGCGESAFSPEFNIIIFYTGIDDADVNSFSVFPNPAHDKIIIRATGLKSCNNIQLIDYLGKTVIVQDLSQNTPDEIQFNTTELEPGIYFIKLESGDGSSVQKLIIQ